MSRLLSSLEKFFFWKSGLLLFKLEKDLHHPVTGFARPFRSTLENSSLGLGSIGRRITFLYEKSWTHSHT